MNGASRSSGDPAGPRPGGDPDPSSDARKLLLRLLELARLHWPAIVLVLLSLPIILYRLGSYSLVNGDEHIYHVVSRGMVESGDWLRLRFYDEHRVYDTFMNAPLQYWARGALIAAFGDNMWTARILTALLAIAGLLVTQRLGRHLTGSASAGFLAGLIQLTTLQFVYLHGARTGELEPVLSCLYTLVVLLFLRAIEEGRSFVWHHIVLALMFNVKSPTIMLPLLAEAACFACLPATRTHFRRWLRTAAFVVPFGAIWHMGQALALWQSFLQVSVEMAQQAASHRKGGGLQARLDNLVFYARTILFGAFPYSLVFPVAVIGILRRPVDDRDRSRWISMAFFLASVLLFYVAVSKHHRWYVMPAYPLFSVFLAAWLHRLPTPSLRWSTVSMVSVVLGLLVTLRVHLQYHPFILKAWLRPMDVYWREMPGPTPWLGVALASALGLAIRAGLRRFWPRQAARVVAVGLVALLVGLGFARVVVPLQFTDYQSETALLRLELDEIERSGAALPELIRPSISLSFDAPYYLGDRFRIVETGEGSFLLEPRDNTPGD
jgi:4-amino-4-deoxy-L-arabinose transferase-like glycosyltransferase